MHSLTIPGQVLTERLLFLGYRGSVAHGMYPDSPDSIDDLDLMGVYMGPLKHYLGFGAQDTFERKFDRWDVVHYEIRKFVHLLLKQNPNVLSALWLPDKHLILSTAPWERLKMKRNLFASKLAYKSFKGYALGQRKKMQRFVENNPDRDAEIEMLRREIIHRETMAQEKGDGNYARPPYEQWSNKKLRTRLNDLRGTSGYMGEKRRQLVEKHGYDCYDAQTTEFLTNSGWKAFDRVSVEDRLGVVDPDSGVLKWESPSGRTDRLHTGKMYLIEPVGSRALITPNHNLLVSPAHRSETNGYSSEYEEDGASWRLESFDSLLRGYRSRYHVRRAPEGSMVEAGVSDEYLALAGFYLSEGCATFRANGSFKSIRFTQKGEGEFRDAAIKLEGSFPLRRYDYPKETVWVLHGEVARRLYDDFGHKKDKVLPLWCMNLSERQAEVLWEHLMLGDGHREKSGDTYCTSLPSLAGDIQAVMLSAGIHTSVYGPYTSVTQHGESTMYHVSRPRMNRRVQCLNLKRILPCGEVATPREGFPVKEIDVENRRVVCFEVPSGTLITRNEGKVAIHGNCKQASHLIRLLRMGIEFLDDPEEMLVDRSNRDAQTLLEIKHGEWSIEQVTREADRLMDRMDIAHATSSLPEFPNRVAAEHLLMDIISWYYYGR